MLPISQAAASAFANEAPGIQLSVVASGTGGGFQKFCAGDLDLTGASRPITYDEMEACTAKGISYVEVPIAYDGISVVVNRQNTWAECLTIDVLRLIWQPASANNITEWRQVIGSWTAEPLVLFGPGKDSGTFDYFTEAVVGIPGASCPDYTASEDDEVLAR